MILCLCQHERQLVFTGHSKQTQAFKWLPGLVARHTFQQEDRCLRRGGVATLIGMIPFGTKIELHGFDFLRERRIQGSSMGSNRFRTDMPRLIEFYMQGRLHLKQMVSGRISLADINQGFAELKTGGIARNVIVFDH